MLETGLRDIVTTYGTQVADSLIPGAHVNWTMIIAAVGQPTASWFEGILSVSGTTPPSGCPPRASAAVAAPPLWQVQADCSFWRDRPQTRWLVDDTGHSFVATATGRDSAVDAAVSPGNAGSPTPWIRFTAHACGIA